MLREWRLLTALLLLAILAYLPGLDGSLLFDDRANLEPLRLWQEGQIAWQQAVLGNGSGPLGRPLAMLSLLINTYLSGDSVWGLKLGNLLLHLACAVALFLLLRQLAGRDRISSAYGMWPALAVTAVWLLHPLMVGTVLYVVQRMAVLSALFVLLALLAFVHGRTQLNHGKSISGNLWLFAGVPLLTLLAAFSKENGLLAPLLCLVLEWVYFVPKQGLHRPVTAKLFSGLVVGGSVIAAVLILLLVPEFVFGGYINRDFTAVERLLTQGRVLFDYVGSILLPYGPKLSMFRDDYRLSTGLFTPISTLFAWLGWSVLIALAIAWRKRVPGFTAGIGIFVVGHAMESSIFPLLIYFEHRNYLPAIGILWAMAALLMAGWPVLAARMDNPRMIAAIGMSALLLVLSLATYGRARIWQSSEIMLEQSLRYYPDSRHLRMELASVMLNKPFPDVAAAHRHIEHLLTLKRSSTRYSGAIALLLLDCKTQQRTSDQAITRAFAIQPEAIEADVLHIVEVLANSIESQACQNLPPTRLANGLVAMLDQSDLPSNIMTVWRLRFLAAKLFAADGFHSSAYKQAKLASAGSGGDLPVDIMLAGLQINLGLYDRAEKLLDEIAGRMPATDEAGQKLLREYREALNNQFADSIFDNN